MTVRVYEYNNGVDENRYFVIDDKKGQVTFMKDDLEDTINNPFWNDGVASELKCWYGRVDFETYKLFFEDVYLEEFITVLFEAESLAEIKSELKLIEELKK